VAGEQLASLISLWAQTVWDRGTGDSGGALEDDVVFENVPTGDVIQGRASVVALLREWDRPPRLTRLQAVEQGRHVLLLSEGPDLHRGGAKGPAGESHLVFTFRGTLVSRIRSVATREAAETLAASEIE
jgi:hypothetical protein